MTRQMADDGKPSLYEAIAVFDKSASRTTPNAQTEAWSVIRSAVAALQAERDALRDDNARLREAHDVVDASARRVRERAERAESALEALRGQVAGLVEAAGDYFSRYCRDEADDDGCEMTGCTQEQHDDAKRLGASLLAIKERMG